MYWSPKAIDERHGLELRPGVDKFGVERRVMNPADGGAYTKVINSSETVRVLGSEIVLS